MKQLVPWPADLTHPAFAGTASAVSQEFLFLLTNRSILPANAEQILSSRAIFLALYDRHNCTHQYKQTKRIKVSEAHCFSAESFSTWVNTELSSSHSGRPGHMEYWVPFFPPSGWITMLHTQSTYALHASSIVTLKLCHLISYGYRTGRHNSLDLKCWCWPRLEMSNPWWTVREL